MSTSAVPRPAGMSALLVELPSSRCVSRNPWGTLAFPDACLGYGFPGSNGNGGGCGNGAGMTPVLRPGFLRRGREQSCLILAGKEGQRHLLTEPLQKAETQTEEQLPTSCCSSCLRMRDGEWLLGAEAGPLQTVSSAPGGSEELAPHCLSSSEAG